jgi:CheY-like chemotaxis protein
MIDTRRRRAGRPGARRRRVRRSVASNELSSPIVLVVDDVEDQRELYAAYLVHVGFRVLKAASGVEAIAVAIDTPPDVVVMDLAMPGLDGFGAIRVLRAVTVTKTVPIIALTGHGAYLPKEWAVQAGCDAYLEKPLLPEDLAAHIRRLQNGRQDR